MYALRKRAKGKGHIIQCTLYIVQCIVYGALCLLAIGHANLSIKLINVVTIGRIQTEKKVQILCACSAILSTAKLALHWKLSRSSTRSVL